MNRRRSIAILAAVLLTVFGTVVLVAFVNSAEQRAQEGAELVRILVAAEEIPQGTSSDAVADAVAAREVPSVMRAADAVDDISELGDQVTVERILAGEPIVARQFGDEAAAQRGDQGQIDEGRQVVTIALEPQRALGGQVAQGDLVGVIVSVESNGAASDAGASDATGCSGETASVLSGIEVTDVSGADPETGEATGATGALMVSMDVDESDAEAIIFGAEYGSIWLTRQPAGAQIDGQTQTCDDVFGNLPGAGSQ